MSSFAFLWTCSLILKTGGLGALVGSLGSVSGPSSLLAATLEWVRPPVCSSVCAMYVCVCDCSLPGGSELYDRGSLGGGVVLG